MKTSFLRWAAASLLLIMASTVSLQAQDENGFEPVDSSRKKMMGGAGFFAIGMQQFDFAALNSSLAQEGFGEFEGNVLSLGGGGYAVLKNFVIGGEGNYFRNQLVEADSNRSSTLQGSNGMFRLGYVVVSRKGFYLYPMIGVGGGILEMQLKQQDSLPTFPDIAANPGRSTHLTANGLVLDGGLGLSFTPKGGVTGAGGPTIGLRLGYQFCPSDFAWKLDDAEIAGGPSTQMGGMYVRLTIGGGGFGRM